MGLGVSHGAFRGAYSAFNRLRQEVARAVGGSYPPHWEYGPQGEIVGSLPALRDDWIYWADDYTPEDHPGILEFLTHSDCDGEIPPEMCVKVADELEELLPRVAQLNSVAAGHLANAGGYVEVLKKFIAGCREAAAANEPLEFR